MVKWHLFLTTIPYVLAVVVMKEVNNYFKFIEGLIDFGDVVMVLTGGIFLIGFMLAGTMADYKESEKIPGELACALESAEDTIVQGIRNGKEPKLSINEYRIKLLELAQAIYDWMYKRIEQDKMYEVMNKFAVTLAEMEAQGVNGSAIEKY